MKLLKAHFGPYFMLTMLALPYGKALRRIAQ
ncbi:MAG: hypothetical protein K0Q90_4231 [Paenibacillaceae bacterium]|jgi:hypothetical protein|nr:hypothetical protein [Paenibacillaceae bacterium]